MPKTKFDFISDLLANNRFNSKQKEKLYKLVSKEIKEAQSVDQVILKGIEEIKSHLNSNNIEKTNGNNSVAKVNESNKSSNKSDNLPKYINPKALNEFLLAYNQDPILKTTCHLIDNNELENILEITNVTAYNFKKHHQKIVEAFNNLEKKHKNANFKVKALIRGYLTGKKFNGETIRGWSTGSSIKINWNCPELLDWVKQNPGIPPNPDDDIAEDKENIGFEFTAFKPMYNPEKIKTFSELTIYFKYLFHIRSDNSLKKIIKEVNKIKKWNEKIDFEIDHDDFWGNIEVFTDVDKLIQAYNKIIEIVLEVKDKNNLEKPKVKLSFKEDHKKIIFSIHHLNSVYMKTALNTSVRLGTKYSDLIKMQINGLCDLKLRADFDNNQYAEVNLWDNKEQKVTKIDKFTGVEHILILNNDISN